MAPIKPKSATSFPEPVGHFDAVMAATARSLLVAALIECKGSRNAAAAKLGLTRRRFYLELERASLYPDLDDLARTHKWRAWRGFDRGNQAAAKPDDGEE